MRSVKANERSPLAARSSELGAAAAESDCGGGASVVLRAHLKVLGIIIFSN